MLEHMKRLVTFKKIGADGRLIKTVNVQRHPVQFNTDTNLFGVAPVILEGRAFVTVERVDPEGEHLLCEVQLLWRV